MYLYELVSKMLAPLNLAVVRRSTLDRVIGQLQSTQSQLDQQMRPTRCEGLTEASLLAISQAHQGQVRILQQNLLRHQIGSKWSLVDFIERERQDPLASEMLQCPLCQHAAAPLAFKRLDSHCIFGGGCCDAYSAQLVTLCLGQRKCYASPGRS